MKKAVIFAPFWRQAGHVGNNRVERFVRWLAADGYQVVMIRAGSLYGQREEQWGVEITVRDPMGLYRDASAIGISPPARKPNKLRRTFSYWLFNPDPGVFWARSAARHPDVLEAATGAAFILSSSPPESAHVGAWRLSRRLNLPHIIDLRDGWLDEPLKPLLHTSTLKRWREGRLEARVMRDAEVIQVTSDVWRELLCKRLPGLGNKVILLTNGYPPSMPEMIRTERNLQDTGRVLVHAGRFSGSDTRRTPDLILQPLLDGVRHKASRGTIKLIGQLSAEERVIIERFVGSFAELGWHVECPGSLPRHELLQQLVQADGLLLLSASYAAIPSKLFEYMPTGKPMLVITEKGSATWQICATLPQAVLLKNHEDNDHGYVSKFLEMTDSENIYKESPNEYTDGELRLIFQRSLRQSI